MSITITYTLAGNVSSHTCCIVCMQVRTRIKKYGILYLFLTTISTLIVDGNVMVVTTTDVSATIYDSRDRDIYIIL